MPMRTKTKDDISPRNNPLDQNDKKDEDESEKLRDLKIKKKLSSLSRSMPRSTSSIDH